MRRPGTHLLDVYLAHFPVPSMQELTCLSIRQTIPEISASMIHSLQKSKEGKSRTQRFSKPWARTGAEDPGHTLCIRTTCPAF